MAPLEPKPPDPHPLAPPLKPCFISCSFPPYYCPYFSALHPKDPLPKYPLGVACPQFEYPRNFRKPTSTHLILGFHECRLLVLFRSSQWVSATWKLRPCWLVPGFHQSRFLVMNRSNIARLNDDVAAHLLKMWAHMCRALHIPLCGCRSTRINGEGPVLWVLSRDDVCYPCQCQLCLLLPSPLFYFVFSNIMDPFGYQLLQIWWICALIWILYQWVVLIIPQKIPLTWYPIIYMSMRLDLWFRALFIPQSRVSNVLGYFEQTVWCLTFIMNLVPEFWVQDYVLRPTYGDFFDLYLSLAVSIQLWALPIGVQLLSVSCTPVIFSFGAYTLSICFFSTCSPNRVTAPLGILFATWVERAVFLAIVISVCRSAYLIMCKLIYTLVTLCEYNDLCFASTASRGFVARFTNHFLVATGPLLGWSIPSSNLMILLLHYASYPQLKNGCLLLLLPENCWGLIMVSVHKVYPLWPKASPVIDPYRSFQLKYPLGTLFIVEWGTLCVYSTGGLMMRELTHNAFKHCAWCVLILIRNNLFFSGADCNTLFGWILLSTLSKYLLRGNVELPFGSFPRPSLLWLQNDHFWSQNISLLDPNVCILLSVAISRFHVPGIQQNCVCLTKTKLILDQTQSQLALCRPFARCMSSPMHIRSSAWLYIAEIFDVGKPSNFLALQLTFEFRGLSPVPLCF